jgi:choice-of-anchor B domain-containing protein
MKFKPLLILSLIGASTLTCQMLSAHSGAHPVRYVSSAGTDGGVCNKPTTPCKTIEYAVNQSSKGDKIHVATGQYGLEGLDIFYLLSDMVEVKGGFSSDFKKRNQDKFQSAIKGIPFEYREKLAKRGFHLIQDSKGKDIQLSIEDKKLLAQYKKMTSKVEGPAECIDGMAATYECHNIDMQSHMPLNEFSSRPSSANDIWGFADLNNDREYAIIGLRNGTAVIDVTDPIAPVEVGTISGLSSTWRDVKVYQYFDNAANEYKAYAYVTTEAQQGLQILDLNDLPNAVTLAETITEFSSAHNVYLGNIDYATGMALDGVTPYLTIEGANRNGGAFRVFSIADPLNPSLIAAPPGNAGYVHDATSLVITDDRTQDCAGQVSPCELYIDFNESTVDVWDVTNKNTPVKLSSTGYANSAYTHSGWWSEDKMTVFVQDELDEQNFGLKTTMHALDISDLRNPSFVGTYTGQTNAIDHNGFTLGTEYYLSNYQRGLSVIDVSDPTNMTDIGFFDTYSVPSANNANFNGAWGAYPYLPSGNILVSDIEYGLFVLKMNPNDGDMNAGQPDNPPAETPTSSSGGGSLGWLLLVTLVMFRRKLN